MSNAPLVFLEAYACIDDGYGPLYATVRVDEALRTRLLELQGLCKQHGLSEVRERRGCDWGPEGVEDELRLQEHELVVAGDEFWFRAVPRYVLYHVETRGLSVQDFVNETRQHAGDAPLTYGAYSAEQWQEHISAHAPSEEETPEGLRP